MTTGNSSISNSLNISPMPTTSISTINIEAEANTETDFNYARGNLYNVIEVGTHALEELVNVAKQTQAARSFEVVSTLINTLVTANKELLELNKTNMNIRRMDADKDGGKGSTINNNLHISASDLLDLIKEKKNERQE